VTESALYGEILREFSNGETRLFRQQSMMAWAGKILHSTHNTITLVNAHPVRFGTPGISDLGGVTSLLITPEHVGQRLGMYVAIEAKGLRTPTTTGQKAFIAMVRSLGGRAGIARSVEDARRIIIGEQS
jgi:hypothetical protein